MEPAQAINTIIDGRYRIVRCLGQGSSGTTYAAEVLESGHGIALKELSLRGLQDWKKIELFEREARLLKTLNHPAIAQYIDFFQVDTADNRWFYLAQTLVPGASLADWVEAGGWVDEAEARRIATAVLEVLVYLHGLNPPVIHRDIKPQNLIRRDDGHIYVVDFGAVQTVYHDSLRQGSTVVGTYGYMAPEQFRGQAVPATDLYSLGATLLFLLTHQSPADLPQERLRINFRPYLSVSDFFADWLDQLVDPLVEDRFASAQMALTVLTQPERWERSPARSLRPPVGTRVRVQKSPTVLTIATPMASLRSESLGLGIGGLLWTLFVMLWARQWVMDEVHWLHFLFFVLPSGIAGLGLMGSALNTQLTRVQLRIDRQRFTLTRRLLGWTRQHSGNTADLVGAELCTAHIIHNDRPIQTIFLLEGANQHGFGTVLTAVEKAWLVDEINAFIHPVGGDR
jgi:hypothetical protein